MAMKKKDFVSQAPFSCLLSSASDAASGLLQLGDVREPALFRPIDG